MDLKSLGSLARSTDAVAPEHCVAVKETLGRCAAGALLERFYEIFLESDERVRHKFANTDMADQARLLRHGVMAAILFAEGSVVAKGTMRRLRESHCRAKLDIAPELYDIWLTSLLTAVEEVDPDATPDVLESWRTVMQPSIDYLRGGY